MIIRENALLVWQIRNDGSFCLMADESSDQRRETEFVILVKLSEKDIGQTITRFWTF